MSILDNKTKESFTSILKSDLKSKGKTLSKILNESKILIEWSRSETSTCISKVFFK